MNPTKPINRIKYQYILNLLNEYRRIDEEHGILATEQIQKICSDIFPEYDVSYGYLFGSCAKGKAREDSDVEKHIRKFRGLLSRACEIKSYTMMAMWT